MPGKTTTPQTKPPVPVELSTKAELTRWVRDEISGKAVVQLPELTNRAVAHFSNDPEFVARLMDEMFRPMVYDIAKRVMQTTRPAGGIIQMGDTLTTREAAREAASKMQNRWTRWLEHVDSRHVRLTDMTKADLLTAAKERRRRGDSEYELAALWEALAERLEGTERVGERFSVAEIERVRMSLAARKVA